MKTSKTFQDSKTTQSEQKDFIRSQSDQDNIKSPSCLHCDISIEETGTERTDHTTFPSCQRLHTREGLAAFLVNQVRCYNESNSNADNPRMESSFGFLDKFGKTKEQAVQVENISKSPEIPLNKPIGSYTSSDGGMESNKTDTIPGRDKSKPFDDYPKKEHLLQGDIATVLSNKWIKVRQAQVAVNLHRKFGNNQNPFGNYLPSEEKHHENEGQNQDVKCKVDKKIMSQSRTETADSSEYNDAQGNRRSVVKRRMSSTIRKLQEKIKEEQLKDFGREGSFYCREEMNEAFEIARGGKASSNSAIAVKIVRDARRQRSKSRTKYGKVMCDQMQRPYRRWLGVSTCVSQDVRYIVAKDPLKKDMPKREPDEKKRVCTSNPFKENFQSAATKTTTNTDPKSKTEKFDSDLPTQFQATDDNSDRHIWFEYSPTGSWETSSDRTENTNKSGQSEQSSISNVPMPTCSANLNCADVQRNIQNPYSSPTEEGENRMCLKPYLDSREIFSPLPDRGQTRIKKLQNSSSQNKLETDSKRSKALDPRQLLYEEFKNCGTEKQKKSGFQAFAAKLRGAQDTSKYINVLAIKDSDGKLPGQLKFKKGQIIKQLDTGVPSARGIYYGYYRVGKLRRKVYGIYPGCHVTPYFDKDSQSSSSNPAYNTQGPPTSVKETQAKAKTKKKK